MITITEEQLAVLKPNQASVVRLIVEGKTVSEVAKALGMTQKTVANYRAWAEKKLGVELPRTEWRLRGCLSRGKDIDAQLAAEPRCARCLLRGHVAGDPDRCLQPINEHVRRGSGNWDRT